jgi:hypothetical protein
MTKLIEKDPIKTLFQDESLPAPYEITLGRIMNDNLVLMRIQDEMRRYFGAIAIAHMSEGELWSLQKRIRLALSAPGATDLNGIANLENAQETIRLHNSGDHSRCTPQSCAVKAAPSAPPREAEEPAPQQHGEEAPCLRPAPARPHVRWYVDYMHGAVVAEVPGDEFMRFSGAAKDAEKFVFRGETCPAHVVAEFARHKAA